MSYPPLKILFEDNHLLVVDKPAGWIVQGAQPGDPSLLDNAKSYIAAVYKKPGNVYLGVVSRLDRQVTGVVPFARTSKAAERLNRQIRERTVEKIYWAVVCGNLLDDSLLLHHWVTRDERIGKTLCHDHKIRDALEAKLGLRRLTSKNDRHLLEITLETGRKHQIRSQLEAIGLAVIGDRKYGSTMSMPDDSIALHCRRSAFEHPTSKIRIAFIAEPPKIWRSLSIDLPHE
jgi:23S rRNA pseudouridine1911/1915/1917 synthase